MGAGGRIGSIYLCTAPLPPAQRLPAAVREQLLPRSRGAMVALGKFDALHVGHEALAAAAATAAATTTETTAAASALEEQEKSRSRPSVAFVSFSGMAEVLGWVPRPPLTAPMDRARVLRQWEGKYRGIRFGEVVIPFSYVQKLSGEEFVRLAADELQVKGLVAGENFRFGYRAQWSSEDLRRFAAEYGLHCRIVQLKNSGDTVASSTCIRNFILNRKLGAAGEMLGRPYRLVSEVEALAPPPSPEALDTGRPADLGQQTARIALRRSYNLTPHPGTYCVRAALKPRSEVESALDTRSWVEARMTVHEGGQSVEVPAEAYAQLVEQCPQPGEGEEEGARDALLLLVEFGDEE